MARTVAEKLEQQGHARMIVTPELAPLAEHFARTVESGADRGALCVMRNGAVLLDIRGGPARPGAPWAPDTLACCFSVTKGVISLLAHHMVASDDIALDTPVASVWPEFAAGGKDAITLLDVLTHRAGLAVVSGAVAEGDLYDWGTMVRHLERSTPEASLFGTPAYHNMTYGHLLGETLRRAAGARSLPELLRERLFEPLGADFRIGLTESEQARSARLTQANPKALFEALDDAPESLFARSMAFFDRHEDFNSPRWRGAVIGSGSGHATARALATVYGQFIWDNAIIPPDRQRDLSKLHGATPKDPILGIPISFGQGIELNGPPDLDFGPNPKAIGHWGAGGAQAFCDPDLGLSFGYVTGHMSDRMGSSSRARRLVHILYECLDRA